MISILNDIAEKWYGWELAMLWQAGLLIAIVAAIDLLIKKWVWPQVRYTLWLLILVKLVLPPSLTSPTSFTAEIPFVVKQTLAENIEHTPKGSSRTQNIEEIRNTNIEVQNAEVDSRSPIAVEDKFHGNDSMAVSDFMPVTAEQSMSWKVYVMYVWAVGAVILAGWLVVRLHGLRREHLEGEQILPERLRGLLESTAKKLGLKKVPQIILTDRVCCPAVFGVFKPVLLMPAEKLKNMTAQDAEHIFLHELAHIKRGDLLVHAIYMILQILYWFNPLIWLTRKPLQNLRELCCDATVAKLLKEKTAGYRQTLLETARELLEVPVEPGIGLLGLFENSSWLLDRLRWLEKKSWKYRPLRITTVFILICVMSACVLPMTKYNAPVDFVIKGRVTDTQTGKPIEGAKVGDTNEYAEGKFFAITDANGDYSYQTYYEEHNLKCSAAGYKSENESLLTKLFGKEKEKVVNFQLKAIHSTSSGQAEKNNLATENTEATEIKQKPAGQEKQGCGMQFLFSGRIVEGDSTVLESFGYMQGQTLYARVVSQQVQQDLNGKLAKQPGVSVLTSPNVLICENETGTISISRDHRQALSFEVSVKLEDDGMLTAIINYSQKAVIDFEKSANAATQNQKIKSEDKITTSVKLKSGQGVILPVAQIAKSYRFFVFGVSQTTIKSERLQNLVEDFFQHNYRDITQRKTIEWGEPVIDANGNQSIRYKYQATIWGKDKIITNQLFVFDKNDKLISFDKIGADIRLSSIDFEITKSYFLPGDSIQITEITGNSVIFENGQVYTIKGKYNLSSCDEAMLHIYATNGETVSVQGPMIKQGSGNFERTFIYEKQGALHLSFYPANGGSSFGGIYFAQKGANEKLPDGSIIDSVGMPSGQNKQIKEDLHNLLLERKEILEKQLALVQQKYKIGQADSSAFTEAKINLLRVESELADTFQSRIDILKQIVDLYKQQEEKTKMLLDAGRATQDVLDKIRLQRLDAEKELAGLNINGDVDVYSENFEIQPYEAGGLYTLTAKIGNKGTATAPAFRMNFFKGDPKNNLNLFGKPQTGSHGAGPIQPGKFWNERSSPFALNEGKNMFFVVLDTDNEVVEANENNNQAILAVDVNEGKITKKFFGQSVKITEFPDGHNSMAVSGAILETTIGEVTLRQVKINYDSATGQCEANMTNIPMKKSARQEDMDKNIPADLKAYDKWSMSYFKKFLECGQYEYETDTENLINQLNGDKCEDYYKAINALACIKSEEAIPSLAAIAFTRQEKDNRDRWMATRALGIIGDKAVIGDLIHLLYHYNRNTRLYARISLIRLTDRDFGPDWQKWALWYKKKVDNKFSTRKIKWTDNKKLADEKQQRKEDETMLKKLQNEQEIKNKYK